MRAISSNSTIKVIGVVRDKDGKPRFDDPLNVSPEVYAALGESDRAYLQELKNTLQSQQINIGK